MQSATVTVVPLEEAGVTPDPDNARLHTPRNIGVIEDSMQTDGAGRSILVDQHGVTIAGAGAWEAATQAGIKHAAVIETDGDTLVVVKRTVTPEQRLRLALADNRATELSTWDANRLRELQELGVVFQQKIKLLFDRENSEQATSSAHNLFEFRW